MPYKKGFGPFAPEVYRAPRPVPVPRHRPAPTRSTRVTQAVQEPDRPVRRGGDDLRAGAGRGRLPARARGLLEGLIALCREHGIVYIDDEVQAGMCRTGPAACGRALRRRARPLRVGQVDGRRPADRRRHRPRRAHGRAARGRPRRHVQRQPDLLRRRARVARPGGRAGLPGALAPRSGEDLRARLDDIATTHDAIGDVRGLGPMLAHRARDRPPDARRRAAAWPGASSSSRASAGCC